MPISLHIVKPYLLYVGVAYPHKNLEGLLKAWKIFCEKYGDGYQLVLAGKKNFFYKKLMCHCENPDVTSGGEAIPQTHSANLTLKNQGIAAPLRSVGARNDSVIFTGFIPDSDLFALYRNAAAFILPSFYEGFGLPPLEAMAYGVPVISSKAACLPEILQDAAGYFDPHNPGEMAEMINKVLNDANFSQKLKLSGQKLYPQYSWLKLAKQTWEVYQNSV